MKKMKTRANGLFFYVIIYIGDNMNLSKSKYCNGLQCKKMLWLDKYKPEEKEEMEMMFMN